ncbi:alpha/beta-hydrolase [Rostrohypoxylon terebratum]|nr:alpha/beta-hydrolase [Rostrohypoxylon terebratum]
MAKPSILLIPGSFAIPELYHNIFDIIAAKGYFIKGLHLPSVAWKDGPRGAPPTLYDDAAFIAKEVADLADEGKDVVLIGHSYGGIPVSQSTKGLTKAERQKQGKKGGIVRLAYMTALVPPLGSSSVDMLSKVPEENRVEFGTDVRNPLTHSPFIKSPSDEEEIGKRLVVFHRLAENDVDSPLRPPRFVNELTHAGYKDVPVSFLFCERDLCILPQLQRAEIEMIEKETGNKVDVTSVNAGHCPSVTAEKETVEWIINVAEKGETL